jgi:hypothetical protein
VPENIDKSAKSAAIQGGLKERPLPRLLQQLYRKKLTGHFVVTDQTGDQSEVYMRDGAIVHVGRPVDTDRLDNMLVEYGIVSAEVVARASEQVADGTRLGEVLDRMGALDKVKLSQVLKTQVLRKLTRLFFVADGTYAVYVKEHRYGEGSDLALMRVDPRTVIYPGIRAAYDLPRVTQELSRLVGQRFRLGEVSAGFITALGMPAQDSTIESLRCGWQTLDDLDSITARPLEVRSVVLALYYCDLLERESMATGSAVPREMPSTQSAESAAVFKLPGYSTSTLSAPSMPPPPAPAVVMPPPPSPAASASPKPISSSVSPAAASRAVVAPPVVVVPQTAGSSPAAHVAGPSHIRPNVTGETVQAIPARKPSGMFPVPPAPAPAHGPVSVSVSSPPTTAASPAPSAHTPGKAAPGASGPSPTHAAAVPSAESLRAAIQDMAQKLDRLNHFEALGVSQNATPDEVSIAFVRAARRFHPDRLSSAGLQDLQPAAERILSRINEASMVLGDASRRAEYVASLNAGPNATTASLPTVLEAENSFLKGEVFLKKGEHARAIECFTMATQGNPSEPQYKAYLAWTRFEDPRTRKEAIVRETLRTLESVVEERPRFARGHYWVGLLWKFLNEPSKAERAFRTAVDVDTSFIDASRELRLIEMRKSKSPAGKPDQPRGGLMGKLFKK